MRTILISSATGLAGLMLLLVPNFSFAASFISQTNSSSVMTPFLSSGQDMWVIDYGSGLSGIANQVSFYIDSNLDISRAMLSPVLFGCDVPFTYPNFGTPTCAAGATSTTMTDGITLPAGVSSAIYFVNFNTDYTLLSSRYYAMWISEAFTLSSPYYIRLRGSSSDVVSSVSHYSENYIWGSFSPVVDFYNSLTGPYVFSDHSYTSNLQPAQASTTATANVNLKFDYHAVSSDNLVSWYMSFTPEGGNTVTLSGVPQISGDHTVMQNLDLISGKRYTYQASVCGSSGTCYGGPVVQFNVVSCTQTGCSPGYGGISTTSPSDLNGLSFFGGSASSTIGSSIGAAVDMCGSLASVATLGLCPLIVFLFMPSATSLDYISTIPSALGQHKPFSYFYEIVETFGNVTLSDSGDMASVTLPSLTSMGVATSSMVQIPAVTLFSQDTVSTYISPSILSLFRTLMEMSLWLALAYGMFKRVTTLFT